MYLRDSKPESFTGLPELLEWILIVTRAKKFDTHSNLPVGQIEQSAIVDQGAEVLQQHGLDELFDGMAIAHILFCSRNRCFVQLLFSGTLSLYRRTFETTVFFAACPLKRH